MGGEEEINPGEANLRGGGMWDVPDILKSGSHLPEKGCPRHQPVTET